MAVITISRQPGSQGDELGASLAATLGYRLVDRTALVRLASVSGADANFEGSPELGERSPSFWERLNQERRRHATVLRRVVIELAEQDDVVIVGLGAGQFLKGLRHVLRLQVVAPMDARIEEFMRSGDRDVPGPLSREKARDLVRQRDREVAGYMRYLFNIDLLDSLQWDVVVNTGTFSVERATALVASIIRCNALEDASVDRQKLADLALVSRVESAVLTDPNVWVSGLKVRAEGGRVHIRGEVVAEDDREAVEELILRLPGVTHIDNDLHIQPPPLAGI